MIPDRQGQRSDIWEMVGYGYDNFSYIVGQRQEDHHELADMF